LPRLLRRLAMTEVDFFGPYGHRNDGSGHLKEAYSNNDVAVRLEAEHLVTRSSTYSSIFWLRRVILLEQDLFSRND